MLGLPLVTLGTLAVIAVAPQLVTWYLGPSHISATPIVRITALSAIPYVVYVLLRSPLDALTVRAINTRNLLIGLLTFSVLVSVFPGPLAVGLALLAALSTVALLSIRASLTQMEEAERNVSARGVTLVHSNDIGSNNPLNP